MKIFISPEWINPIAKSHCLFKTANNATVSATKEEALNLTAVKMELESLRIPKKITTQSKQKSLRVVLDATRNRKAKLFVYHLAEDACRKQSHTVHGSRENTWNKRQWHKQHATCELLETGQSSKHLRHSRRHSGRRHLILITAIVIQQSRSIVFAQHLFFCVITATTSARVCLASTVVLFVWPSVSLFLDRNYKVMG